MRVCLHALANLAASYGLPSIVVLTMSMSGNKQVSSCDSNRRDKYRACSPSTTTAISLSWSPHCERSFRSGMDGTWSAKALDGPDDGLTGRAADDASVVNWKRQVSGL